MSQPPNVTTVSRSSRARSAFNSFAAMPSLKVVGSSDSDCKELLKEPASAAGITWSAKLLSPTQYLMIVWTCAAMTASSFVAD